MQAQLTLDFSRQVSEVAAGEAAIARFEDTAAWDLRNARHVARQWALENRGQEKYGIPGGITADDLRSLLDIPRLARGTNNFLAGVWQERDQRGRRVWMSSGRRWKSATEGSHGNDLIIWQLSQEARFQ